MKIVLTGSRGFIGSHLVPMLAGHELACLDRRAAPPAREAMARTLVCDLNDSGTYARDLSLLKPDCCIHLAWSGLPDYSLPNCRANLQASLDLFEALERAGCRKVFAAGTCWEYGSATGLAREDAARDLNVFAAFKSSLQSIGRSMLERQGIEFAWGRIFFAYGPGQRPGALIPSCYRSLKQGTAPQIGNPLASNDFIHVDDVASAIKTLAERDAASGIYDIGAGRTHAVWEVVNLVAAKMGRPPVYPDAPYAAPGLWADTAKLRNAGWAPQVTLADGIGKTIEALESAA